MKVNDARQVFFICVRRNLLLIRNFEMHGILPILDDVLAKMNECLWLKLGISYSYVGDFMIFRKKIKEVEFFTKKNENKNVELH